DSNRLLSAASDRKSDFVARASHELRTPLTSIKGSMEYVTARLARLSPQEAGNCPQEELRDFFQLITKNTDRLIRMVNTMLDIERIEMGMTSAMHYAGLDLAVVIRETVVGLACLAEEKEVWITSLLPENLPLLADEDRIRQVLTNLLANAIKFTPDQSTVTIRAFLEEGFAVVEVQDQGAGIPTAMREKVFDKFYKLGNKEGSGLGLTICRSIIAAHGGVIGVADSRESGACLYFWLPARGE
ncbi:MAG: HAMP domain-containing histidine kinase, partial [Desulfurivibrio sp.]|nr:HAMP domain-containing histidine kinase [Desulfurivibrio sp.]